MNIWTLFTIVLLLLSIAVAACVDFYKKVLRGETVQEMKNETCEPVRKTKAKVWEIISVAGGLSTLAAVLLWFLVDIRCMISQVNALMIVPYAIAIYILQKPACMTFVKNTGNVIFRSWLRKRGVDG